MPNRGPAGRPLRLALLALLLAPLLLAPPASPAAAQAPQGATLTVVSGTVAVVRRDGTPLQPAASGLALAVGDRVATVGRAVALVTFFEGSELELGDETTIILRELRSVGDEVRITVEDVLGTTYNRVRAFVNPSSLYTVQSPGGQVVALIRGSDVQFTQFEGGSTYIRASCTRPCSLLSGQAEVCQGIFFICAVDARGGVHEVRDEPGPPFNPDDGPDGGDGSGNPNEDDEPGSLGSP